MVLCGKASAVTAETSWISGSLSIGRCVGFPQNSFGSGQQAKGCCMGFLRLSNQAGHSPWHFSEICGTVTVLAGY